MKNTIACPACDFAAAKVTTNAKGAMSVSCSECGYQAFVRSPKAVAALQAKLGGAAPGQPAAPGKPDVDDDWTKKL